MSNCKVMLLKIVKNVKKFNDILLLVNHMKWLKTEENIEE